MKLPTQTKPVLRKVEATKVSKSVKMSQSPTRAECVQRCGSIESDSAFNLCIDTCLSVY